MFPQIHFSPVCEFLVIVHTAKTGLLRCCLYTPNWLLEAPDLVKVAPTVKPVLLLRLASVCQLPLLGHE